MVDERNGVTGSRNKLFISLDRNESRVHDSRILLVQRQLAVGKRRKKKRWKYYDKKDNNAKKANTC